MNKQLKSFIMTAGTMISLLTAVAATRALLGC